MYEYNKAIALFKYNVCSVKFLRTNKRIKTRMYWNRIKWIAIEKNKSK